MEEKTGGRFPGMRLGGVSVEVLPVIPSPRSFGYRSKLTPHYQGNRQGQELTIGFLRQGSRRALVDVTNCPIATDTINDALPQARENLQRTHRKKGGGTLLLREVIEGVVTDPKQLVSERVGDLVFHFKAGEFFQNNPYILPKLVEYVISQADAGANSLLVDAYCGGGLFGLSAASRFQKVVGIEISREGFEGARTNAQINRIKNAQFYLGDAGYIFEEIKDVSDPTALIIDPPEKDVMKIFSARLLNSHPSGLSMYPASLPLRQEMLRFFCRRAIGRLLPSLSTYFRRLGMWRMCLL